MCKFATNCKNTAEFVVIHKAVEAMPERHVEACNECASRIGVRSKMGRLIDAPNMDGPFYKLEKM